MRVRKSYLYLGVEICEDLAQSCMLELWKLVRPKKLPQVGVGTFHSFLNTVLHRKIAKTFDKEIYDDGPKRLDPKIYIQQCYYRLASANSLEDAVFLQELPDHLRSVVAQGVPFVSQKRRDAVGYVLECLLDRRPVVSSLLRREYGISDTTFIVDYTTVAFRRALYELKSTLKPRVDAEKREILNDGIEDYFGV